MELMATLQLLILGNGFDLHCGLKSSYKDFFRSAILDEYSEHCGYPVMQKECSGFWENILFGHYKLDKKQDYSWCDIEKIIRDILWLIVFGEKCGGSPNINHGIWRKAFECVKLNCDPEDESKRMGDPIKNFLFIFCSMLFYNNLKRNRVYSDEDALHLIINKVLQELHNFEKRFCKYLKGCIIDKANNLNEKYIVNAMNLLAKLTGFTAPDFENMNDIIKFAHEPVMELESSKLITTSQKENKLYDKFSALDRVNILSFNYTSLFDILGVRSPCAYSNVHGELCNKNCEKDCDSSSIIFGIDDTAIHELNAENDLRVFSKTYRKMSDTSSPIVILPPVDNNQIEIKFYGHSLNKADYSYFQSIFDYYNIYGNSKIKLIFYYSSGYEQQDAIYRLINEYGTTLTNKDQGKNLMHKLLLENRLKIEKI